MENRLTNNIFDFNTIKIEFIDNNSSSFWFDIKNINWFEVSIKEFDWYYIVELWSDELNDWRDYLFDKNRNLITWEQRKEEIENRETEAYEIDSCRLERKRKVDLKKQQEYFNIKVFLNWKLIEEREISAMWEFTSMEDEYKDFLRRDKLKSDEEKSIEKYKNSSLDEKLSYWTSLVWSYIREWDKFNINDIRNTQEENIDLFLNSLVNSISDLTNLDRSEVLERYFILDEIAKSHIRTETIEWIDFSFEELAKKMWDLFYEPLASMLNSIAIELERQIDSNNQIVNLLIEASNHILKAWDHCKPYITDINELEKNSKHTFDIKNTSLSNEELARAIAYLENNKLKEFLELLSKKLQKDWLADEWRKRLKLANELFEASRLLKEVWESLKE